MSSLTEEQVRNIVREEIISAKLISIETKLDMAFAKRTKTNGTCLTTPFTSRNDNSMFFHLGEDCPND